ncbi:hypothetical protein TNCV_1621681 [Trichonephila clavipes]|nr:hypothetical protein TNCV_1621681 [Trichonephila clavipes]
MTHIRLIPEKSLGVSKRHRKARWMQCRSLFGQLVGLFISMNEKTAEFVTEENFHSYRPGCWQILVLSARWPKMCLAFFPTYCGGCGMFQNHHRT